MKTDKEEKHRFTKFVENTSILRAYIRSGFKDKKLKEKLKKSDLKFAKPI